MNGLRASDLDGGEKLPPVALGRVGDGRGAVGQRLGAAPLSVLTFSPRSRAHRGLAEMVGDLGATREGSRRPHSGARAAASVPSVPFTAWLVEAYSHAGDIVLDPFSGGPVRPVVAAALDRRYYGVELRAEQVAVTRERISELRSSLIGRACVLQADSTRHLWKEVPQEDASLILTSPPFWQAERYGAPENDLSEAESYAEFMARLSEAFERVLARTRPGAFVVAVVEPIVHPATGEFLDLPGHVEALLRGLGCRSHDRVAHRRTSPASREAGRFDVNRRVIRQHEEAVVCRYLAC